MDKEEEKSFDQETFKEPPIDEASGVNMHGFYANGPDYYVLSLRQNAVAVPPQTTEPPKPKPQHDGPFCPQCGNAVNAGMKFCPECGTPLSF